MSMSFGIILPTIAQKIPSYVPTNGLVGWWPFNGNANDESGNGNHGTVNGATLTADRNGESNKAYSFNGINNFIEIKDFDNLDNKTEATFSIWVKSTNSYSPFCKSSNTMLGDFRIQGNTNSLSLIYNGQEYIFNGINGFKNQDWNHFIIKIQNMIPILYLNNISITKYSFGVKFGIDRTTSLKIGSDPWGNMEYHSGQIDDIAIYNRALTQEEITNLYKGCAKETATLNPTNGVVLKNASPITLSASPAGGVFAGEAIANGQFAPAKANLGTNTVNYRFTNSTGCQDTTQFKVMVYDTLGNVCSSTDTLKIKVKLTTGVYSNQTTNLSVYPNPTSDVLIIDASDVKTLSGYSYRILDIQGKEVYKAVVSNAKTEISLKTIGTKGVYILHILDANNTSIENKKIVLE